MNDSKFDIKASRRDFISGAGTTLAAAAMIPVVAAAAATTSNAAMPINAVRSDALDQMGAAGELHQTAGAVTSTSRRTGAW